MPEGDTVYRASRKLNAALAGRPVTRFDLRVPALALADLSGNTLTEVVPRGKHILMRFSNGQTLHSHLRMDGGWRIGPAGAPPRGRGFEIRALVGNAEYLAAGFRVHDLKLLPTENEHEVVGHLGPDLLAADFDRDEALRRFAAQPSRPIGEALLDQRLVAGIGNVYKCELMFLHRLNPFLPVGEVPDIEAVIDDAVRLLRGNVGDNHRSTTGWRQPGQQTYVHGRTRKGCRRCGTPIVNCEQGADPAEARITYYCPTCQAMPA
ncbi:MAG: Fpg/Nei family DNA glycosylase [Actinobacteria bacterium]|nr:Fpg/Nei family DNA glycosylase [Actinomycetota bacterium]